MSSRRDFSLASFGHGLFQKSILKPILAQLEGTPECLILHQPIIIGMEVSCPDISPVKFDEFIATYTKFSSLIDLTYSLKPNEQAGTIYGEAAQKGSLNQLRNLNETNEVSTTSFMATPKSVLFYKLVNINIPDSFKGKLAVLTLMLHLNTPQSLTISPTEHSNITEIKLRQLLDQNRFRTIPVPPLKVTFQIKLERGIEVMTTVRELDDSSSMVVFAIENKLETKHVTITCLALSMERTRFQSTSGSEISLSSASFHSVFTAERICAPDQERVVIPPREVHHIVYRISLSQKYQPILSTNLLDSHLVGHFSTPFTIFYSQSLCEKAAISSPSSTNAFEPSFLSSDSSDIHLPCSFSSLLRHSLENDNHSISYPSELAIESTMNWSLGTHSIVPPLSPAKEEAIKKFATTIFPSLASVPNFNALASPFLHLEEDSKSLLDVFLHWPRVVELDRPFGLEITIINRRHPYTLRNVIILAMATEDRMRGNCVVEEGTVHLKYRLN